MTPRKASPGSRITPGKNGGRRIILPKQLEAESARYPYDSKAHSILQRWEAADSAGKLVSKETSLNADFLNEVFGDALGWGTKSDDPDDYGVEREFHVPGIGSVDGALGRFSTRAGGTPVALIELKGPDVDLDRDRSNGRTAVGQLWDYLNATPDCPWGILSNFVTVRLYHRDKGSRAFEQFALHELKFEQGFREFATLLDAAGLRGALGQKPRALRLLEETAKQQQEVGEELYEWYRKQRDLLIRHLIREHEKPLEAAVRVAQRLVDRVIFVAFCEDRGLMPEETLKKTYETIPPVRRVTNPRWRNFLDLFRGVDKGPIDELTEEGYNGGLFAYDREVDDLQFEDKDSWVVFFGHVGKYDFRDEVNVEVLGHLFEKSVTELEKIKLGGLVEDEDHDASKGAGGAKERKARGGLSAMPKSAQRKRFGIYYTPPAFTGLIVDRTLGALIKERFALAAKASKIREDRIDAATPEAQKAYWRACLDHLTTIKVCDPACGSGAFLIRAYEELEDAYQTTLGNLAHLGEKSAERELKGVGETILRENLYGVDLSPEAVEITQLALWIRSAVKGRKLQDISKNIVCGNSLVSVVAVDPLAFDWRTRFAEVFNRPGGAAGFDCVIGNPPWERMKVQEREFFAYPRPDIAQAVNAAERRRLIGALEKKDPDLFARYTEAKARAERALDYARKSGRYPLTGKGDVNLYVLFAELARSLVAPGGIVGLLTPSGIATDDTTKEFFATLVESNTLRMLFDFENKKGVFPDVHKAFKFCAVIFGGTERTSDAAEFAFFCHDLRDLDKKDKRIALTSADLRLLNPNTRTCPIFRTKRDAEITKAIYRRVPVLVDEHRKAGGNPWGVKFVRMFDQTNDAESFLEPAALKKEGWKLDAGVWKKGKKRALPLYEAKMVQAYDHRAASVIVEAENWVRQGQKGETTPVQHQNPEFVALPRWWVAEETVIEQVGKGFPGFIGYKDITSATNQRTMIAAFLPWAGVVNSAPLILTGEGVSIRQQCCLLANLNSFALDYTARQKVGSVHLNFFIVEQLPVLPPDAYAEKRAWTGRQTLEKWVSDRVLKLTCTADDMRPLAEAAGFEEGVHKWNPRERAELLAELDAAYFHLYGLQRDDVEYVLSTFQAAREQVDEAGGLFDPGQQVLRRFDDFA